MDHLRSIFYLIIKFYICSGTNPVLIKGQNYTYEEVSLLKHRPIFLSVHSVLRLMALSLMLPADTIG